MAIEEKLDRLLLMIEHLDQKMTNIQSGLHEFRSEMHRETAMLRYVIGGSFKDDVE